jgi:pyruvate,water dikinase
MKDINLGAKARSLVNLAQAGFPVPEFRVIPFQVYREAKAKDWQIPETYRIEFGRLLADFQDDVVAVRSSASKEDGELASFAGLFKSFLDIRGAVEIEESVINCWLSTDTERTQKYCERNQIQADELDMAVIIQKYIDPDFAGVVFTMNPISGNDSEMLVEACLGSGEKLVSGQVNPSRFTLNRDGAEVVAQAEDPLDIAPSKEVMLKLRMLCKEIQALYGKPQDIEFAVKDGEVHILQSRDITKIQFAKSLGEWTTADFRDGGVSSGVVSPVMWSLYEKIFAFTLPEYFVKLKLMTAEKASSIQWYKVFYGRPYWNLRAVKDIQEQLPGYNERNFDKDMSLPIQYEGDGVTTPWTLRGLLKALPVLGALHKEYDLQSKRSEELLSLFSEIEKEYLAFDYAGATLQQLHESFTELIFKDFDFVESEYFKTIYNASNAKMEFSDALKDCKKIDPSLEYVHLISELGDLQVTQPARFLSNLAIELCQAHPDIVLRLKRLLAHTGPVTLKQLSSEPLLQSRLGEFVERFYFHSERELDLSIPRWSEDLTFVLETLQSMCAMDGYKASRHEDKPSAYLLEMAKLKVAHQKSWRRWLPGSWTGVISKLERIRHFLWLREEVRDRSTRMYYFIRKHLLHIGERSGIGEDIFHLSYLEIFEFLNGTSSLEETQRLATQTKMYAEGFRKFKNPNEIGFRFNNASWLARSSVSNGHISYFGIGCSAGVVRARVCVIKDISESSKLKRGEILVVPFTDPGWTPLFNLAAGVVTETGGLLSHAALISREYGIPCVLNVNGATDQIPDGAMVELEGMEGRVTLL